MLTNMGAATLKKDLERNKPLVLKHRMIMHMLKWDRSGWRRVPVKRKGTFQEGEDAGDWWLTAGEGGSIGQREG